MLPQSPHLWCLATLLSVLATVGAAESVPAPAPPLVLAGPWLEERHDGGIEVAVALTGPAATCALERKGLLPVYGVFRSGTRSGRTVTIATAVCPPEQRKAGSADLVLAGLRLPVVIPERPHAGSAVRVALAGIGNYPNRADLISASEQAGLPIQAMVLVGDGVRERLGSGGWEARLPVMVVTDDGEPWRWGVLGVHAGVGADGLALATARDLSPWPVGIVLRCPWNPGLMTTPASGSIDALWQVLSIARRQHVPLLLAEGGKAGWISEPFGVDGQHVRVEDAGVRLISAVPAGDGLASLVDQISAPVDQPALIVLHAVRERLTVELRGLSGGASLAKLEYARESAGEVPVGSGFGLPGRVDATAEQLRDAWLAGGEGAPAALEALSWLTRRQLAALHLTWLQLDRLAEGSATDPVSWRLMRRLIPVDPTVTLLLKQRESTLTAVQLRDLGLRQLAHPETLEPLPWRRLIASGSDPALLRAVLHAASADRDLLIALGDRLHRQSSGAQPLEGDAMLQHRLVATVFDSDAFQVESLVPLAQALRPRLDALSRGPVDRFLLRVGIAVR